MKPRFMVVALPAVLAVLVGCGGKKKGAAAPAVVDRGALDALWRLAPATAEMGVVFGPGALERMAGDVESVVRIVEQNPQAAASMASFRKELQVAGGPYLFDLAAWRERGVDPTRGAAIFLGADQQPVALVLPVADRATFVKSFGGTSGDADEVGGMRCRPVGEHYMCGPELPAAAPAAPSKLATRALATPEELRGEVELVATEKVSAFDDFVAMDRYDGAAMSLRLPRGAWILRGLTRGKVAEHQKLFRSVELPKNLAAQLPGAVLAARAHLDLAAVLVMVPASIPLPGVDLRPELIDHLTGDALLVMHGAGMALHLTLRDADAVRATVQKLCKLAAALPAQTVGDVRTDADGCSATASPHQYSTMLPSGRLMLRVEEDRLVAGVERSGEERTTVRLAGDPVAGEILEGRQGFGLWMRALEVGGTLGGIMDLSDDQAERELAELVDVWDRLASRLYEVGFASGLDDEGAHLVVVVTTMGADPDEVVAKYDAALALRFAKDDAGYRSRAREIVAAYPDSLAATHLRLVGGDGEPGTVSSSANVVSMIGALAIPAFTKYIRRSKTAEANQSLHLILMMARARFLESGTLVESVGPTPAPGSCCQQASQRCERDAAAWADPRWKALAFEPPVTHFYSYQLVVERRGDDILFIARAIGDLDCDGTLSTMEVTGHTHAVEKHQWSVSQGVITNELD